MRKIFGLLVYLGILGGLMLSVEAQIIRPTPTPILPSTESCVTAGDYYQLPASSLKLVDLKAVQISAAVMLGGRLSPLSVGECSGIKGLDIIIPWSESTAETLAAITWSRIVCNGLPPQKVSITLSHGTALTLVAYNEKGVVVDKLSTRAASTAAVTYSLSSEDGIRRIEMVGAEICISRICWLCRIPVDEPTPTPTPTLTPTPTPIPSDYTCINPSQFLQLNQSSDTFSLNAITVHAALDASGAVVPLTTANCTDDKRTSIFIPWSEDTAGQLASIEFSEKLCNGLLPTEVQLIVRHGNHAKFIAYDSAGTIVDSQAAADDSSIQTITLKSPTGIRLIEIIGSEICLIDICWRCEPYEEPVQKAEWVPIDPNARPGQPIQVVVESANESETQLVLKIPGFWRTLVKYGGRVFTKIEFPRVGSLAGSGFSEGKEWFQFPSRLTAPSLSSSRYSNALAIRINQPIFPADLMKLERWPSRAEEMSSLGIDPLGARPMIPTIAGFFCAMGQGDGEDVTISAERFGILNQRFEYPLVPAGFTGEDQAQEDAGYTPPQLVDEEFYNSFKGTFDGLGKGVRRFGTIGFFPTVESYVPLIQVHTGNDISVPQEIYVTVRQNKGVLPTDFRKRISMVSWDEWVNKPSFVNGNSLVSKLSELGVAIEAIRTAHYLILTPESYVPSLSEFITWKQSKGLLVKTVIVGSGTGADVAADRNAIDAYLENYYNTWSNKTIYVLLIGDVDVIPSGRTSKINAGPDYSDADSDHVYGVIGNENIAKLYVGRLSCNSTGELQNQLDKILSYERGDVRGSWPRQVTLCANSQNDDGSYGVSSSHPSKYAAAVNTIANYMGYSNPPTFQVLHAGASNNTTPRATNQDVINAINAGRGQVLYRGHGSSSAWSSGWDGSSTTGNSFDHPTDVNQLTNTIYPIVYSIACQNNRLRVSDCVGEAWMSSEHGAVAYWGATVNSWTTENHQRALSIFRSIYEYNNETLGPALANAEYLSYLSSSGSDSWQSNTFCYLLLGDPELSIRKNSLLLTLEFIPHITPLRQGSQLTLLNENKEPLVGQLVSVKVYGLEERISGYTNEAGELILDGVDQSRIEDIQLFSRDYSWVRKQFEIVIPTPTPVTSYADPIWVDQHATGAELGTTDQPFHSISAAMAVAVTHTIRVREGIYTEPVILKNGVKLIGEGFERTVIDLSGTGTAVTATNTGNTTLLSGFRIQNAERGIVCTNASLTLQENYITHINPTSLNSDGITLTNSSPLIRHNVIYHVGGMGIRGQGNSQPQIINNTIVDYRYYAGISFAALDIGAVAPVIKNNIIARGNTEPVGGILWKIPASPQLSYNTVFDPASVASGSSHYAESDGAGTWTEKSGGLGALESDPLFVNAALGIFTLSNFSPCIDAGDPAAVYNDLDGSRNDMGAFGGKRAEAGGGYHLGSGFLFTSVGKIPVSSIVQDEANPSFGLAQVSAETATQFSIPAFMDSPFGGHLWIRGLFGIDDDIDYYRIVATPLDGSPAFDLKDPLTKTLTTFALDGTPIYQQIQLGPTNVGGIDNLYKMNKTGYWSQQDLRMIWNTTGLNGRYRLQVIGYRELSPGNLTMVPLPWNEQSEMVLWLDNMPVQVQIENVFYANGDPLVECEDILFPHAGSEQLLFQIQAYHPNGFLDYVLLDAWWGENKYGGQLTQEQYVGENDTLPPLWYGYYDELLPPLSPVGSNGLPMEWEDCAYRFRLYARARTTDGTGYLHWNTYNVYHAIETGVPVVAALATQTDDCPTCPVLTPRVTILSPLPRPDEILTPVKPIPIFDPIIPDLIELPTAITIADFEDTWVNIDPMTGGITQITLAKDGSQIAVHAFGQCHPTDCDWDTVLADFTGNPFVAFYDQSFVRRTLTLYLLDRNTLQVTSENDYQDGRTDFTSTYTFVRETVWVDDDNVSEIENGTIANPFNTIQEGLAFAIYGQTVRVLPGLYTESVVMKDGVNLIGSGAEQTIIAPGLGQRSVDFIGLSDGEVLQGFTIRNAALGVYCHSSSPVIRENIITDIDYSSLSGDGIRLDDASPQILNNVIYHVGGMGIRGQSHSEPSIINNTIYDYGYYAGISFSALNIGEVYPFVINNIVVRGNSKPVGGIAWSAPAVVTVAYNTVYDPAEVGTGEGSYYMYHDGTRWNEMDGGDGALNVNPLFEEALSGNFHLELDSPCIDAGHPSALFNDNDGSRNDMGAYGGQRLETSAPSHAGSGFVFTSIGKVPLSEIVADPASPSHGLLRVSDETAAALSIPKYMDTAFGGTLWIRGLFGEGDDVDYYQVLVASEADSTQRPLNDPLTKIHFTINEDGTVTKTPVRLGPQNVGGVSNLYEVNKTGYWTYTDLRFIWNTSGLNGKYTVTIRPFRKVGDTVQAVTLPSTALDHFTIVINNRPVEMKIHDIQYADGTSLAECEKIHLPHAGNSHLIFTITASHPDGFLRDYTLNCYWGNNRYGGEFVRETYVGMHDSAAPVWAGVVEQALPALLPRNASNEVMEWHTCPYHFSLSGWARITDGYNYLRWSNDNVYQSILLGPDVAIPNWTRY